MITAVFGTGAQGSSGSIMVRFRVTAKQTGSDAELVYQKDVNYNGAGATVVFDSPLNGAKLAKRIDNTVLSLKWEFAILQDGAPGSWIPITETSHKLFVTATRPCGAAVTLKRMDFATKNAKGESSYDKIAKLTAEGLHAFPLKFETEHDNPPDPWARLDQPAVGYDCLQMAQVAAEAMKMLGISAGDDRAHPTGSCTDGKDSRNTDDQETKSFFGLECRLGYREAGDNYINKYEGHFWFDIPGIVGDERRHRMTADYHLAGPYPDPYGGLQILHHIGPSQVWFRDDGFGRYRLPLTPIVPLPPLDHCICPPQYCDP